MIPIILAGGSGTRLWPLSRPTYPKQFQSFGGTHSLFALTLKRAQAISKKPSIVVCGHAHQDLVRKELKALKMNNATVIVEPEPKNTAPAVALAVMHATDKDDEFMVLPADHMIADERAWRAAVLEAQTLLADSYIVCLGARVTQADSNYGYIQRGDALGQNSYRVALFKEKPDMRTAQEYARDDSYYWNCGIFVLRGADYRAALKQHAPKILSACQKAAQNADTQDQCVFPDKKAYATCPSESIDYAVMEHVSHAAVVPVCCGWSDMGNWGAVWSANKQDTDGNMISGDVTQEGCTNNVLMSTSRLLAAVNVENLIAVETEDAVMIADKNKPQDIKQLFMRLQASGRKEAQDTSRVYRPWGFYQVLAAGENFQIKLISVDAGARLSLQMHHHRAEHWVVMSGEGLVQCGEKEFVVQEQETAFIPKGSKHRLSNQTKQVLQIIEVQSGSYLGEDDIVRFEDMYGR